MPRSTTLFHMSIPALSGEQKWTSHRHVQWRSIKRFLSIATTMSSVIFNFDLFAKISTNVRLFDYLLLEMTVGISYLCMDCFIKQYTKRFDCNKDLNPLLRGISYGQFLQTGYFSLVHGAFIVDTIRLLVGALKEVPAWAICQQQVNITCIPVKDVILHCNRNKTTAFVDTSAFVYYVDYFTFEGRKTMTSNLFVTAIVWIVTFFLSSVTEEAIVKKIFRLSFAFRTISTVVTLFLLLLATKAVAVSAFLEILDMKTESSWATSMQQMTYTYGIGFLGLYDFGTISPYTMMDTASVIFMGIVTCLAFMRSWILKILYLGMIQCVEIDKTYVINTHKLLYAVLPMTTEFIRCKKFFILYIFGNMTITLMSFETFMVSTMSKFLHCEFRTVKQIYIIGIICASGFVITVIITFVASSYDPKHEWQQVVEIDILLLYLSGLRAMIIFWLYGVKRFATDIHFWLGFHPTRFWTVTWAFLPIVLLSFMVNKCYVLLQNKSRLNAWSIVWIALTTAVVTTFHLRAIAKYIVANNIIGLFKASRLYGPPDADDRKRRPCFNEVTRGRKCRHNCIVIDEYFECDHDYNVPIKPKLSSLSEEPSVSIMIKENDTLVNVNSD